MAQSAYLSPRPSPQPLQRSKTTSSARRSGLFRPPQSPGTPGSRATERRHSSTRTPNYASATATSASRKRARPETSTRTNSHAWQATPQSDLGSTWSIARSDFASPEPFVNTRYNLAGGLDTPGQARETYFDRHGHEDYGVRRRWTASDASVDMPEHSGEQRRPTSNNGSPEQQSWGQFVFSVAGKVWQFGSSAFKGFYAGGGQGYGMHAQAPQVRLNSDESIWESVHKSSFSRSDRESTPVPGSYPVEEDESMEHQQRPSKKVHLDSGESPWVVVQNPLDEDEDLHRKRSIHRPPPPSRPSTTTSRPSLKPVSRRTSSYLNAAGSPATRNGNRPSYYAHQRSTSDITPVERNSPMSPEARKYLQDRKREERQQDASIKRMNDQLKALLKEGRQALGTKVEVVMDNDGMDVEDEGYYDDRR